MSRRARIVPMCLSTLMMIGTSRLLADEGQTGQATQPTKTKSQISAAPATRSSSADRSETANGKVWVYIGSYARENVQGIHVYELDLSSGELTSMGGISGVTNPSFLAIAPDRRCLYCVCEVTDFRGGRGGGVSAFSLDEQTGRLTLLNQQTSGGAGPCHLVVDRQGKNVLVANYGGGSVAVLPLNDDGRVSEPSSFIQHHGSSVNPQRQTGPHAHSINLDAANRFAFVADLGLDKVLVYRFDPARGKLEPNEPAAVDLSAGSGPRHFAFHPNGQFAYVINELASTVTAMRYDPERGTLEPLHSISTLPKSFDGSNTTAEVQVHPSGKYLYGSNRGHDSIAIFAIDTDTGRLTAVGHESTRGRTPRNFGIDPTGTFLLAANQASDTVVVFRIDEKTGQLEATDNVVRLPAPVCVKMLGPLAQ